MSAIPRPEGYLTTLVRNMRVEAKRRRPARAPGVLTQDTTAGVVRRPTVTRRVRATGGSDTWA
jgi:hypothetical protein